MTAAIECLHRQYPGQYLTDVDTTCNAIFEHNPHVTKLDNGERLKMEYPLIHQSNQRPVHFLQGFTDHLGDKLGIELTCSVNRPYLYFSEQEKKWLNQVAQHHGYKGKFWLVNSGYKTDFAVKAWHGYQDVVDHFQGRIQFVQVGEKHTNHKHKPLAGAINLVGQTTARQLLRLAYHAEGILCGESFLHHVGAALQKPTVCIASGLTPKSWQAYNSEVYLTMQGRLPCCLSGGCWKHQVVPGEGKGSVCTDPVFDVAERPVPKCMAMISPVQVLEAIESFYSGGLLSASLDQSSALAS